MDHSDPDIAAVAKERAAAKAVDNNNHQAAAAADQITSETTDNETQLPSGGGTGNHLGVTRENSGKKKKSSVIQQTLSHIRKRSTRKRSERVTESPASYSEPPSTPADEGNGGENGGRKSAVATLFVNLARKPSMARKQQKKSVSPATADSAGGNASSTDHQQVEDTKIHEPRAESKLKIDVVSRIESVPEALSSEPIAADPEDDAVAAQQSSERTAKERWRMLRNVSRVLGRLTPTSPNSSNDGCKK